MEQGTAKEKTPLPEGKIQLKDFSPASARASKEAVTQCWPQRGNRTDPYWINTSEFAEGVSAFIEKRIPNFKKMRIISRKSN